MNIYVDFDDCLCETAKHFTLIVEELFNRKVQYEEIRDFNLQKSFALNDEQYEQMMIQGHLPDVLCSYEETPEASDVINEWLDLGHKVFIITGRPYSAYEPSRRWLDEHQLKRVPLYCLNKYGRDSFIKGSSFSLELEDYYRMKFDFAVEDSPVAFPFFRHLPDLNVLVFDRPWNRNCAFPGCNYHRCFDWEDIRERVRQ